MFLTIGDCEILLPLRNLDLRNSIQVNNEREGVISCQRQYMKTGKKSKQFVQKIGYQRLNLDVLPNSVSTV